MYIGSRIYVSPAAICGILQALLVALSTGGFIWVSSATDYDCRGGPVFNLIFEGINVISFDELMVFRCARLAWINVHLFLLCGWLL